MKIALIDSGLGLIPFVKEILFQNKKNIYYLYMDKEYFPYGNKSFYQLKKRLIYLINKFEKLNIDYIYICCNTLSKVYLDSQIKTKIKIKTILKTNLKHLIDKTIIVTPTLKKYYKKDKRFIQTKLAEYIQKNDIKKIIDEINYLKLNKTTILGCTHFPLIKNIIKHFSSVEIKSYENEFVSKIPSFNELKINVLKKDKYIVEQYFPFLDINEYDFT